VKQILRRFILGAAIFSIGFALIACSSSNSNSPNATATPTPTPQTWALKKTLSQHQAEIFKVVFTPDSRTLLSGGKDHLFLIWDVAEGKVIRQTNDPDEGYGIGDIALASDGDTIAVMSIYLPYLNVGKLSTLEVTKRLMKNGGPGPISFSPDGKMLAASSINEDEPITIWDVESGKVIPLLKGQKEMGSYVLFSPDGKWLLASGGGKTARLWDVRTGELKLTLSGHALDINSAAFSPDGATVATASEDMTIKVWDVQTGALKQTLTGHGGGVRAVAFSPDGRWLASGSRDKAVKLWDPKTGALLQTLSNHGDEITTIAFSPDGKWLASAGYDKSIKLWSPN
jgi:WD40 repeat protein